MFPSKIVRMFSHAIYYIGVRGEKDVLGVCGSLLRLLVCLWEKAPLELVDVVPASLVSHWDSFTGDESPVCACVRVCVCQSMFLYSVAP